MYSPVSDVVALDAEPPTLEPGVPSWVDALVPGSEGGWRSAGEFSLRVCGDTEFTLISVRLPDAVELGAPCLEARSAEAYRLIAQELASVPASHPVRWWNFIPHILSPLGEDCHRYMVFNAGRYLAMEEWLGSRDQFPKGIATASGVGHHGGDLLVHCLAAKVSGQGVENPRQTPAYCYSSRYGRRPPSFARATRLVRIECPWLLVGGTASVLGEDSAHGEDLEAQLGETLSNLGALVDAALGGANGRDPLSRFRNLRTYYVRPGDRQVIAGSLQAVFGASCTLEYVRADLCRPELLVEIEGVAELAG